MEYTEKPAQEEEIVFNSSINLRVAVAIGTEQIFIHFHFHRSPCPVVLPYSFSSSSFDSHSHPPHHYWTPCSGQKSQWRKAEMRLALNRPWSRPILGRLIKWGCLLACKLLAWWGGGGVRRHVDGSISCTISCSGRLLGLDFRWVQEVSLIRK